MDAGKTTLSEALLYESGMLKKPGRVDKGDAFLDTDALEKARGITIFSKQAVIRDGDRALTLLDTPGHVDFSAEMERALWVMDYGILVISGSDGVQGHTLTLWRLLERYRIPVFLFINKMDQPGTSQEALMAELQKNFGEGCVDFTIKDKTAFMEQVAMCDEAVLEDYVSGREICNEDICGLIRDRKLFPCYFGSALRLDGVEALLAGV